LPRELFEDPEARERELRPFEFAVIAAGDETAFRRIAPRFARKKAVEKLGLTIGGAEEFTAFVSEHTQTLANLFLQNFDPSRPAAARNSVLYVQKVAVSWYLTKRTRPIRADAPNLQSYLTGSMRLAPRTKLAIKLAYLPVLLTPDDRKALRDEYGFRGTPGRRMPVKDIAALLRYPNAEVLSRKLYRIRAWCRRNNAVRPEVASS
jgi:hypothetical protein